MRLKRFGVGLVVLVASACGSDGPDLPVPAAITVDPDTDEQVAFAGARLPLPLAVNVTAADGSTVARAEVRWSVLGGLGAVVSDSVTVSDGTGRAEVSVMLDGEVGTFGIRAALVVDPNKSVTFSVGALAAPRLTEVTPTTFAGNDTVLLKGVRLSDSLPVEIGGARARTLSVSVTGQAMSVEVPACLVPGTVQVRVLFPGGATSPVSGTYEHTAAGLQLAVGEHVSLDPAVIDGCAIFPAAGPSAREYVVIPQATTTIPNRTANYQLGGEATAPLVSRSAPPDATLPLEIRFHDFLRRQEEGFSRIPKPAGVAPLPVAGLEAGIEVGDRRQFKVCNTVTCNQLVDFADVTAVAKFVGERAAIYLDIDAPDTLSTAIFEEFGALFDEDLYPVATRTFGSESDIDQNGHVLILMTPVVNGLTPESECEVSIITGFFFAIDVDPSFQNDPRSNRGEIFYALTPDPSGTVGCTHTVERVRRLVPVTFVHEVQHMISYNQHVLVRGNSSEVLWLNEAMSHLSEDIAAFHFSTVGDSTRFTQFALGNLYNAYLFLQNPGATFVLFSEGAGTLAERGGAWLMLRWFADQFGASAPRRLSETDLTGALNLESVAGQPFAQTVSEWMLANWVSDLPDFTAPERLRHLTWSRLRWTYGGLHSQLPERFPEPFPIQPFEVISGGFTRTGVLRSGSGEYFVVAQPAGEPGFSLSFRNPQGGPLDSSAEPRLSILRTR